MKSLGEIACSVGKGLAAGLAATAAMTVSSTVEMKLRNRPSSNTPAEAFMKILQIEPKSDEAKAQISNLAHWGYGTGWGVVLGMLHAMGLRGNCAMFSHFVMIWGTALVMLPALKLSPPVTEWSGEEAAIDAFHHVVYASAAEWAFSHLEEGE